MNRFAHVFASMMLLTALMPAAPAAAAAPEEKETRMLVTFEEGTTVKEVAEAVTAAGGEVTGLFEEVDAAAVELTDTAAAALLDDPAIAHVEEDIRIQLSAQTPDWGIAKTNTPAAWNSGFTGNGVKVAVIDSGIAPHSDLKIAGGISTVSYTTSYSDDFGHGTHVAGIIGALDNSYGVKGAAHGAALYSVKAFDRFGGAYLSDLIEAIDWSVAKKMDIINLSAGSQDGSPSFQNAVDKAYASGSLVVAAAGNDGTSGGYIDTVDYPARYSNVIAVAAVDRSLKRASFSSSGPAVEVSAPGVGVLSTYLNGQYTYMDGTSMATPYVSGVLALMKQAYPNLSNKELRQLLQKKAQDLGTPGRDSLYGYGFIQASSFTEPQPPAAANPVTGLTASRTSLSGSIGDTVQVTVSAKYKDGTSKDITKNAKWTAGNPAVASVSAGAVKLTGYGSTTVTASFEGKSAAIAVNVPKPAADPGTGSGADRFSDLSSFYFPAVNYLVGRGITDGLTATTFGVEAPIKRADAAVWLARELELDPAGAPDSGFTDVPGRAAGAVNALKQAGIIGGKTATRFGADDLLTRGEIALILDKAYGLEGSGEKLPFTDVSSRYYDSVDALVTNGVTNGVSQTKYGVSYNLTRGQLAVFLYRLAD